LFLRFLSFLISHFPYMSSHFYFYFLSLHPNHPPAYPYFFFVTLHLFRYFLLPFFRQTARRPPCTRYQQECGYRTTEANMQEQNRIRNLILQLENESSDDVPPPIYSKLPRALRNESPRGWRPVGRHISFLSAAA
jgi:hypothetical protein